MPTHAATINRFWFDKDHEPYWFVRNDSFDRKVKDHLLGFYEEALHGQDDAWHTDAHATLALIILFDQVPRNVFRGTAQAFATDERARTLTRHALAHFDMTALTKNERLFIYMPLQHSENLQDQEESCRLYASLNDDESLDFAQQHHAIIKQFGRFPHRNEALGRTSTPQEKHTLKNNKTPF
ncbi:MAG: DUF924 domain-containing protein [Alphaproteobacteria bacterium GM202ARS2]|nr:DUF924 domain-containing protein [Alphaproteobacteria bacterium GM202ARS2]